MVEGVWSKYRCDWLHHPLFDRASFCCSRGFAIGSLCTRVGGRTRIWKSKFLLRSRRARSSSDDESFCQRCRKTKGGSSKTGHKCTRDGAVGGDVGSDEVFGYEDGGSGNSRKQWWCKSCRRAWRWKHLGCSSGLCRFGLWRSSGHGLFEVHFSGGSTAKGEGCSSVPSKACGACSPGSSSCRREFPCHGLDSTKFSSNGSCLPFRRSERPSDRYPWGHRSFYFHQRRAKARANAAGSSCRHIHLLSPSYATVAQEAVPVTALAEERRRVESSFCPDLLGADRGLQACPGCWSVDVVAGICCRCRSSRGSSSGEGKACVNDGGFGSERGGRRLVSGLSPFVGGGSTSGDVYGQDKCCVSLWKAIFEPGTSSMVVGGARLCQRDGSTSEQKAGKCSQTAQGCRSRESIAKEEASFPKEASLRSGALQSPVMMRHEEISCLDGHVPDGSSPTTELHADNVKPRNDLFDKKISFASWCAQMVASVFRTRTPFSAFVRSAIHLTRDPQVSTSPAFPIPLPHFGVFDRMPSGLSLRQRSRYHFRRAVVLTILALNFWWSGNRFIDLNLLRRSPSVSQRRIIRRVVDFMQVDGPKIPFEVSLSGRRSPQLIARLCELSDALTSAGVRGSPYDHTFEGRPDSVPVDNSAMPELEPYRSLDYERLLVVGEGHFDPVPYLDDNLCMAYCNPDCLLHPGLPGDDDIPVCRDSLEQVVGLMRVWDVRGLLVLHENDVPGRYPHESVRIFNCYKNSGCDRQIGDRRGRNFCEMKVFGPSKLLPAGPDVFEFFLGDGEEVHVSISDRRDFYHQFRTTYTRAISNTLSPGLPVELIEDTKAFSALMLRKATASVSRHAVGDGLFSSHRFPKPPRGKPKFVFGAFASILQGDHGGVEYACQAHEGLLQSVGLLPDENRIVANRPFQGDSIMQGLVIDDFFVVSKVPRGSREVTPDVAAVREAIAVYDREKIIGSPSKDLFGERTAKVIGAHINGSDRALDKGICPLGSPSSKRFALAWLTFEVCALPYTTDVLHVCLLGGWVSVLTFRRPLMSILNESFRLVDSSAICPSRPRLVKLPRTVANELTVLALLVSLAVSDLRSEASDFIYATDASLAKGAICRAPVNVDFARFLWRISRSKGAYHRLMTPLQTVSKRLGLLEETWSWWSFLRS